MQTAVAITSYSIITDMHTCMHGSSTSILLPRGIVNQALYIKGGPGSEATIWEWKPCLAKNIKGLGMRTSRPPCMHACMDAWILLHQLY